MRRRDFLKYAGAAGALTLVADGGPRRLTAASRPAEGGAQGIDPLPPSAYRERLARALELMPRYGLSAIFCEPSTDFAYLAGTDFGRSERLIALVLPAGGEPLVVAPQFEVERVQRDLVGVSDVRGWEEDEDPFAVVADALAALGPGAIGIEPSTRFGMVRRLEVALPGWEARDASALFESLRIVKSEDELRLIRRAASITESAIAATFAALERGLSDREVARILSEQMTTLGARGGGLVQFGPTSALPHGGSEGRRLERGTVVLIDAGCRVHGYASDITRTIFFGDEPPVQFREVFDTVLAAQSAAFEAARPGMECQELDRIARQLISEAGYGRFFSHRLGHGLGMDGHEPPYLVKGNSRPLEPGMVFTIEPGIYLPGQWGVRIEDDFVVRSDGLEPLSTRVSPV
jgi:Xaa-Pro dipeptidase